MDPTLTAKTDATEKVNSQRVLQPNATEAF